VLLNQRQRFLAGSGFGNHAEIGLVIQVKGDAGAQDRMVIGDDHADRRGAGWGGRRLKGLNGWPWRCCRCTPRCATLAERLGELGGGLEALLRLAA